MAEIENGDDDTWGSHVNMAKTKRAAVNITGDVPGVSHDGFVTIMTRQTNRAGNHLRSKQSSLH
jgi:hypothetical protein